MAIEVSTIEILQTYFNGVMERTHHAPNVEGVALALLGAVIWRSTGEIEVREYAGRPANMLWFYVGDQRYTLLYDHVEEQIQLLERSGRGDVIAVFDNSTPYNEVIRVFGEL